MVKRYDPIVVHHSGYIYPSVGMQKDPDGHYVLYSDYAKLEAERDRMKAALVDIASADCNKACEWLENDCDKCMLETARQALWGGEGA